jgi:hypothetical protein
MQKSGYPTFLIWDRRKKMGFIKAFAQKKTLGHCRHLPIRIKTVFGGGANR